ncbi:MAG: hypothetical protein LT102_12175 [Burkholderiaceae bacterium]|nr:hypothetical protein [Burkholderiaceae bacterium]
MTRLRTSRSLARLVAAWFALFVILGSVAPWMQASAGDAICSVAAKTGSLPTHDAGHGDKRAAWHSIECPLCLLPLLAPPAPGAGLSATPARFVERAFLLPASAPVSSAPAAPLPARGPPSLV